MAEKQQQKITLSDLNQKESPELVEQIFFWLVHHQNKIYGLLGAVVAVFLVVAVIGHQREGKIVAASDALFHAMEVYEKGLSESEWATPERAAKMKEAREAADKVIADFPGTPAARNALFLKGNALYFEGEDLGQTAKTEQALTLFQEYLATLDANDHFERAAATLALGYANENLSVLAGADEKRALDALNAAKGFYEQLIEDDKAGFLKYEGMLAMARLYSFQQEPDNAKKLLTQVLKERRAVREEPDAKAGDSARLIYQIQQMGDQFSSANSARIGLIRLGEDPEKLLADDKK